MANTFEKMPIGQGVCCKEGEDIAILSIGHPGNFVTTTCSSLEQSGISVAHYNMRFVKPLDAVLLHEIGSKFKKVITIEDGTIVGGFGSACLEFFVEHNYHPEMKMLGIPDRIVEHGKPAELHAECGYDAASIVRAVERMMAFQTETI